VVVSIFVNALQFDRKEDTSGYARTLTGRPGILRERAADLLFAPDCR